MKKNIEEWKKACFALLIVGLVIFAGAAGSDAQNKIIANEGETGYSAITNLEQNYLSTADGRFRILSSTKISNEDAVEIKYRDIQKSSLVDIEYKRISGELTALQIFVKSPPKEKAPE
jgi:hypothetical protein